jgi:5-methylcytosine-specific restriction endonuclease McrA
VLRYVACYHHAQEIRSVAPVPGAKVSRSNPDPGDDGRVNNAVLVLNQNYEPLNVCNIRRAIVLVIGGKAEILEANLRGMSTASAVFPSPSVIRLMYMIKRPRPRVKLTRREIFIRDDFTCQYCGTRGHELTIDHIIPRSRGGPHEWDNVVASCKACNHRKGGKSVAEARMALRNQPHEPRAGTYYTIERRLDFSMQDTWQKFLPGISPSPSLHNRSSHSTNPA